MFWSVLLIVRDSVRLHCREQVLSQRWRRDQHVGVVGSMGPERRLITHSGRKHSHFGGARCLLGCTGSVPVGALAYWHWS